MGMFFDEENEKTQKSKFDKAKERGSLNGDSTEKLYEVNDLVDKSRLHSTNVDDYVYRRGKEREASSGKPFTEEESKQVKAEAEKTFATTPIGWYRTRAEALGSYNPTKSHLKFNGHYSVETSNTPKDQRVRKLLGTEDMVLAPGSIGINPVGYSVDVGSEGELKRNTQAVVGHEMRHALDFQIDRKDKDEARHKYRDKTLEDAYGYIEEPEERVTSNFDVRNRISSANGGKIGKELDDVIDAMSDEDLYKYLKSDMGYTKQSQYRRKRAAPSPLEDMPKLPFEKGSVPDDVYHSFVGQWERRGDFMGNTDLESSEKARKRYLKNGKKWFGEEYEAKMRAYDEALNEWYKKREKYQNQMRDLEENPTEIDPDKMKNLRKALKTIARNEKNEDVYNMFLA